LYEPLTKKPNLLQLRLGELVIPVRQIVHGVVEPLGLMLRFTSDDTATHDVLKHLIAGLFEGGRHRGLTLTPLSVFGHAPVVV
jgi:hypothetical protein